MLSSKSLTWRPYQRHGLQHLALPQPPHHSLQESHLGSLSVYQVHYRVGDRVEPPAMLKLFLVAIMHRLGEPLSSMLMALRLL
jgi:hypothetical protein